MVESRIVFPGEEVKEAIRKAVTQEMSDRAGGFLPPHAFGVYFMERDTHGETVDGPPCQVSIEASREFDIRIKELNERPAPDYKTRNDVVRRAEAEEGFEFIALFSIHDIASRLANAFWKIIEVTPSGNTSRNIIREGDDVIRDNVLRANTWKDIVAHLNMVLGKKIR